jgi:hypothetical protein
VTVPKPSNKPPDAMVLVAVSAKPGAPTVTVEPEFTITVMSGPNGSRNGGGERTEGGMRQPARSTENAHFKSGPDRVFGLKIANIFAAARADPIA